jgi:hypothetical protein
MQSRNLRLMKRLSFIDVANASCDVRSEHFRLNSLQPPQAAEKIFSRTYLSEMRLSIDGGRKRLVRYTLSNGGACSKKSGELQEF